MVRRKKESSKKRGKNPYRSVHNMRIRTLNSTASRVAQDCYKQASTTLPTPPVWVQITPDNNN